MAKKITIIIEDDELEPTLPRRQELYRRLDAAQDRARKAYEWVQNCGCNPANGGSGLCSCVNPHNQLFC